MTDETRQMIAALRLEPLPHEGGFFRQTWCDAAGSAIYFLLTKPEFSALHRLRMPEIWHFYAGDPVEHVQLNAQGAISTRLGPDVLAGQNPQLLVPPGTWQGARLPIGWVSSQPPHGWALLGCTLAPPWSEADFELGQRDALLREFPAHDALIRALTR
jgi:predicted cupin superfamily sugar epimerase